MAAKNEYARDYYRRMKLERPEAYKKRLKRIHAWRKAQGPEYRQKEHKRHWPKVREQVLLKKKIQREALRKDVIIKYGSRCVKCGFDSDLRILQIDHINGGGHREKQQLSFMTRLKKVFADTQGLYQVLCPNCNMIKFYDNNEVNSIYAG